MLSISSIAKMTGYSTATVSRTLDRRFQDRVKPETREKIISFCAKVGYRPNFSAQSLGRGQTGTVGIIVPWIEAVTESPTYGHLLGAFMEELKKFHQSLALIPVSRDDQKSIQQNVLEACQSSRVDAFLSLACFLDTEILDALASRNFPLVSFSMASDQVQHLDGAIHCRIDSTPAIKALFKHLRGFSKIAMIGVLSNSTRNDDFMAASPLDFFQIEKSRFFLRATALAAYQTVISRWPELQHYRAIVCSNDLIAHGVCQALITKGRMPGRDVAVTGFDDLDKNDPEPFLTTIRPPLQKLAAICVTRLQQLLDKDGDIPAETAIPAELIIRCSSVCK